MRLRRWPTGADTGVIPISLGPVPARKRTTPSAPVGSERGGAASGDTRDAGDRDGNASPGGGRPGIPAQGRELRARGQRTMRRLLDAGIEVFATRGYHSARVDDIVKAAKTSHGTFYLYFANKEDLFQALVGDVAEQLAALTDSLGPVSAGADGRDELREWLGRFADVYESYGPVIRTWTEAEIDSSEVGRLGTDALAALTTALAERARPVAGTNPQLAAMSVVAMIERFNYFVVSRQVDANRDEMLDTLADVVHRALFA
jgi:AcrR family transcriptional regulator